MAEHQWEQSSNVTGVIAAATLGMAAWALLAAGFIWAWRRS